MSRKGRAPSQRKMARKEVYEVEMREIARWLESFADDCEARIATNAGRWESQNALDAAARRAVRMAERLKTLLGTRGEIAPEPIAFGMYHNGPREEQRRPCPVCERRARQGRPRAAVAVRAPRRIMLED